MDTFLFMLGALGLAIIALITLALPLWGLWLLYKGLQQHLSGEMLWTPPASERSSTTRS